MKLEKIKIISLNDFLDIEFKFCFVCGLKKYNQFYFRDHIYRVCNLCLKKNKVRKFFGRGLGSKIEVVIVQSSSDSTMR